MSLGLVMPWKFVDEAEPPAQAEVLVWNGEHIAVARCRRGKFIARSEGIDVLDPWENPVVVKGVTHWQPAPKPPQ
jgi:hypothetical protein